MKTLKKVYEISEGKITLSFDYEGEDIDPLTIETLEKNLGSISYNSIIRIICLIRATFHKYQEKYLSLKIDTGYMSYEIIFEDKILKLYSKRTGITPSCDIETRYKKNVFYSTKIIGENIDSVVLSTKKLDERGTKLDIYNERVVDEIRNIQNMKTNLKDDIDLMSYYKAFYGCDADMTLEDSEIKLQIMMFILHAFGIIDNLYQFEINQTGYEYMCMSFEKAFLPCSHEIEEIKNRLSYIKDLNTNDVDIKNREKVLIISELIRETTNFDIDKLTYLAIVLYIDRYVKDAEIEERTTGRKKARENGELMQKALHKKWSEEKIQEAKNLLEKINKSSL